MSTADILDKLHESLAALHNDQELRLKRIDERDALLNSSHAQIMQAVEATFRAIEVLQQQIDEAFGRLNDATRDDQIQAGLEEELAGNTGGEETSAPGSRMPSSKPPASPQRGNGQLASILGGKQE